MQKFFVGIHVDGKHNSNPLESVLHSLNDLIKQNYTFDRTKLHFRPNQLHLGLWPSERLTKRNYFSLPKKVSEVKILEESILKSLESNLSV